jgi:hypothetical protein
MNDLVLQPGALAGISGTGGAKGVASGLVELVAV